MKCSSTVAVRVKSSWCAQGQLHIYLLWLRSKTIHLRITKHASSKRGIKLNIPRKSQLCTIKQSHATLVFQFIHGFIFPICQPSTDLLFTLIHESLYTAWRRIYTSYVISNFFWIEVYKNMMTDISEPKRVAVNTLIKLLLCATVLIHMLVIFKIQRGCLTLKLFQVKLTHLTMPSVLYYITSNRRHSCNHHLHLKAKEIFCFALSCPSA